MSYKIWVLLIFEVLLLSSCDFSHTTALQRKWPIPGGRSHIYSGAATRRSCIYLWSKDSICGIAKFIPFASIWFDYIDFLPAGAKSNEKNVVRIKRKKINFVRVYPDNESDRLHYIDYYYIGHKKEESSFGWVFAKQGNVTIYLDDLDYNYDTTKLKLFRFTITNVKDTIDTPYVGPLFRLHGTPKPADVLLKLINERYKENFKREDFADANAMAKYILDKENSKSQ